MERVLVDDFRLSSPLEGRQQHINLFSVLFLFSHNTVGHYTVPIASERRYLTSKLGQFNGVPHAGQDLRGLPLTLWR